MATEKRLIDLDAYEDFKTECLMSSTPDLHSFDAGFDEGMERAAEWLYAQPTADSVEVVHGEWLFKHNPITDPKGYFVRIVCSECDLHTGQKSNYCPNCGAKMDLKG